MILVLLDATIIFKESFAFCFCWADMGLLMVSAIATYLINCNVCKCSYILDIRDHLSFLIDVYQRASV